MGKTLDGGQEPPSWPPSNWPPSNHPTDNIFETMLSETCNKLLRNSNIYALLTLTPQILPIEWVLKDGALYLLTI